MDGLGYSGGQESTLGRSPSCHLPTLTAASKLPFNIHPATDRYFEIVQRNVDTITAAGRMLERGNLFLPTVGQSLKALEPHDRVKIALQPACHLITSARFRNVPGRRLDDRYNWEKNRQVADRI